MTIMTFLPSACGNCRLYFPRGVIHHAPNQAWAPGYADVTWSQAGSPSVHLTISSFQRQSLYDLVQKTFDEVILKLFFMVFDGFLMVLDVFGCFLMFLVAS